MADISRNENNKWRDSVKSLKGSFTVEATIIIPIILFLMISVLKQGITFYKETIERESPDYITNWDAVSTFYDVWVLKEIGEVIGNE